MFGDLAKAKNEAPLRLGFYWVFMVEAILELDERLEQSCTKCVYVLVEDLVTVPGGEKPL